MIILLMMQMKSCSLFFFFFMSARVVQIISHVIVFQVGRECFLAELYRQTYGKKKPLQILHLMCLILTTKSSNNIFNVFSLNVHIFIVMTQTMHMLTHQPAYQAPSLNLISQLKHHTHLINKQNPNKTPFSLQRHSFLDFIPHTRNKNGVLRSKSKMISCY